VAAHMGQALGTVKSWVRRALLSLKACLDSAASADAAAAPRGAPGRQGT
jgi:DNA-directed RNA polymerase specialized sigma24 family protein